MPDFDRIGADFDRVLPFIQPVTEAVLNRLPALPAGATVLDVACGTGEPGLTLARRSPDVRLLGVDSAAGMIAAARDKAARESLPNARFEVMPSETLVVEAGSVDAVISRFGLLLFGDPAASARELARVLRAGGRFSFAAWDLMSKNTLAHTLFLALRDRLPPELVPPFERLDALAAEGRREGWLRDAGLRSVRTEMFSWAYEFPDQQAVWDLVSEPGVAGQQIAALGSAEREQARLHLFDLLADYRGSDGAYRLPHACRLFWGER